MSSFLILTNLSMNVLEVF